MTVKQHVDAMLFYRLLHLVLVDVHDFEALVDGLLEALPARLLCDAQALLEWFRPHRRLPFGISHHLSHALVLYVVRA